MNEQSTQPGEASIDSLRAILVRTDWTIEAHAANTEWQETASCSRISNIISYADAQATEIVRLKAENARMEAAIQRLNQQAPIAWAGRADAAIDTAKRTNPARYDPDMLMRAWANMEADKARRRDELAKRLPPGTCLDCEGTGEQGGQFTGGTWSCETCGGTGKQVQEGG